METLLFVVFAWSILGLVGYFLAKSKGRDPLKGCLWSVFLGPIGWLVIALSEDQTRGKATDGRPLRKCPHCAEMILREAKICKHCRKDLPVEDIPRQEPLPVRVPVKDAGASRIALRAALGLLAVLLLVAISLVIQNQRTESAKNRAQEGTAAKSIQVTFDARAKRDNRGFVRIEGRTNLPEGTKLLIGLRSKASAYFAQSESTVLSGGSFVSDWFSKLKKAVPPGSYTIEISSGISASQPELVRSIIGKMEERLSGSLVSPAKFGGNMVSYSQSIMLAATEPDRR